MLYHYVCNKCIEVRAGKALQSLSVDEYNLLMAQLAIEVTHDINEAPQLMCEGCGASMRKILGVQAAYIRGYGLLDKRGAKNDMNLHSMVTGNDPYAEHRKQSDAKDLILKLQRNKEHNAKPRSVFLS